jgi:hypothetical protein
MNQETSEKQVFNVFLSLTVKLLIYEKHFKKASILKFNTDRRHLTGTCYL